MEKILREKSKVENRHTKDSEIKELGQEFYVVSWKKFRFFYDLYGCD